MTPKELNIVQILVYYDEPHLFLAEDPAGTKYMCLLIDEDNEENNYAAVAISLTRLSRLKIGEEDLRKIFTAPENREVYYFKSDSDEISAILSDDTELPDRFLPLEGFDFGYSIDSQDEKQIAQEAIKKLNLVARLKIEDSSGREGISIDDIGETLNIYQSIIEYGQKKYSSSSKHRNTLKQERNYKLRADYAMTGSLIINMFSEAETDIFGHSSAEFGLMVFDEITLDFENTEDYIASLQKYKGYTLSSLKRLATKVINDGLTLTHMWTTPGRKVVGTSKITSSSARKIVEVLNISEDLTEEIVELIGVFVQVDLNKLTWRLISTHDKAEYSGVAVDKNLLSGVIVNEKNYRIVCIDILEEIRVSGKSKHTYTLKELSVP